MAAINSNENVPTASTHESIGSSADQEASNHDGSRVLVVGDLNRDDEIKALKGENKRLKIRVTTLESEKIVLVQKSSKLGNENVFLKQLLGGHLQKDSLHYVESGDEESVEEDEEDDMAPALRRTLASENVLTSFGSSDRVAVVNGIEDSLFDRGAMNKNDFMQLLLSNPLNSCLLSMDAGTYETNIAYIARQLSVTTNQIKNFADERDRLKEVGIPSTVLALKFTNNKVTELKKKVEEVQKDLAEKEQNSLVKADELERLQDRKEELVSSIQRIHKTAEVATLLKTTMQEIISFHRTPGLRQGLPLAMVSSESDSVLIAFKQKCGLSGYASTKLSKRKHIKIARAVKILGIEYSPYFTNNRFSALRVGTHTSVDQLREQTCKALGIPRDDGGADAAVASATIKRKTSDSFAPASKKTKMDDDATKAMELFISTEEGKAVVMKNPSIQALVMGSPKLQEAFLARTPASSNKKSAAPKSDDGSGQA